MSISEKYHQYYTIYCIPTFGPTCVKRQNVSRRFLKFLHEINIRDELQNNGGKNIYLKVENITETYDGICTEINDYYFKWSKFLNTRNT